MACMKCKRKSEKGFCDYCFSEIIVKRIRKGLRSQSPLLKGDTLTIIDDGTVEGRLAIRMLPDILAGLPVIIKSLKQKFTLGKRLTGKNSKVIIPWNADLEAGYFLESISSGKKPIWLGNYSVGRQIHIKLFLPCLQTEIVRLARINGIKNKKKETTPYMKFLDDLEKEYPEVKFSLLKSIGSLGEADPSFKES